MSSVGESVNGGSHTWCAGAPWPATPSNTASKTVRTGSALSLPLLIFPTGEAVNTRGLAGAVDGDARGLRRPPSRPDTKDVWKRTRSPDADLR